MPLKDSASIRLIGKPVKRTDSLAKATGDAEFGIDVKIDGMLYAAVKQAPVFGGSIKSFDKKSVLKMPGVIAVDAIPNGVAVITDHYWHAKTALEQLTVNYDESTNAGFSSKAHLEKLKSVLDEPGVTAENAGDAVKVLQAAAKNSKRNITPLFLPMRPWSR